MKGRTPPPRIAISPDAAHGIATGRPGVYVHQIMHDDWCRFFATGDPATCNCDPEERIVSYNDLERAGRLR